MEKTSYAHAAAINSLLLTQDSSDIFLRPYHHQNYPHHAILHLIPLETSSHPVLSTLSCPWHGCPQGETIMCWG